MLTFSDYYVDFFGIYDIILTIKVVIKMLKREAYKKIKQINNTFRVLLVTGPRQVGKTTLLTEYIPNNMSYVTLDDIVLREQAKTNPKLFLQEHPWPLLIDEAQYAPELFPYIKIIVDKEKQRGMYWLTGSQQIKLMKNVQESLAGRVGIVKLNSLTYSEIVMNECKKIFEPDNIIKAQKIIDINTLFEKIFRGGMPELYDISNMNKDDFFYSYVETYLSKDVKDQLDILDVNIFKNFMISVATRNGEQLNYSNIANEIGITDKTVKTWLNILVNSGVVYLLEPFMNTKLKRITHMPKIVFMDSGLCSYLAGWSSARDLQLSEQSGHYLETYVISEIIKSYNSVGQDPKISYYRDKEKNEIDLIFEKNNKIYPFEIKKTANPTKSMIKNFEKIKDINKSIEPGGIICCYDELIHLDEKNYIIPISSVINL